MSIGGYKYKGFSILRSNYATSEAYGLAIHKLRVHAFLQSCIESQNTQRWDYRTGGDIAVDDKNGIVHVIAARTGIPAYQGYATYFHYNDENNTPRYYFLILTLPTVTVYDTPGEHSSYDGTYVEVYINNVLSTLYNGSPRGTYLYGTRNTTCFYAISLDDFGTHPKNSDFLPNTSTRLMPSGGINIYNSTISGFPYTTANLQRGFLGSDQLAVSFGYCTKQDSPDIIEFCKPNNTASQFWNINVISPEAISQLIDQNDDYRLLSYKVTSGTVNSDSGSEIYTGYDIRSTDYTLQMLTSDGVVQWGCYMDVAGYSAYGSLVFSYMAMGNTNDSRKYASIGVIDSRNNKPKGYLNQELIATSIQNADLFGTTSNGSYCMVRDNHSYSSGGSMCSFRIPYLTFTAEANEDSPDTHVYTYIGWDVSNPALGSTDACPLYTPDMS